MNVGISCGGIGNKSSVFTLCVLCKYRSILCSELVDAVICKAVRNNRTALYSDIHISVVLICARSDHNRPICSAGEVEGTVNEGELRVKDEIVVIPAIKDYTVKARVSSGELNVFEGYVKILVSRGVASLVHTEHRNINIAYHRTV